MYKDFNNSARPRCTFKFFENSAPFFNKIFRFFYIKSISPVGYILYKKLQPVPCQALFKDKVVAVVGPAVDLSGQGLGERIDQADVVVKFNRMVDFGKDQADDYGRRVDILVHGLLPGNEPGRCGKISPARWKQKGVNAVIYPFYLDSTGYCIANYFISGGKILASYKMLPKDYRQLSESLQCMPTSGMLAIMLALQGQARSVDVYGFSFFRTGHNRVYFKSKKDFQVNEKKFKHSSDSEFELVRQLRKKNKNLHFIFPNPFFGC